MEYNHKEIEPRIRQAWKDADIYRVSEDASRPKYYVLDMFPYHYADRRENFCNFLHFYLLLNIYFRYNTFYVSIVAELNNIDKKRIR